MDMFFPMISVTTFVFAFLIAFVAGWVKGVVGFAMPMIMISGLASVVEPQLALAGLILPTLVTNTMQALRQGIAQAYKALRKFWAFLLVGLVFLLASAQLVAVLPTRWLFLGIGVPIILFSAAQLLGWKPSQLTQSFRLDAIVGAFAGFIGGLSGIWGPPTVVYLTALNTPKEEQIRLQGVIYGLGAFALLGAHFQSGVISAETLPFSAALIVPSVLGMWLGLKVQGKIDQNAFRMATLVVLLVVGLNLVRRALMG
ncbi:sulfite exporter TauE/SafE family protein [Parasulfitobacter algicola]|uniref:Probable membrane transporter protein n=1 Tax=Parasulfitobacter algicola TaxID=2614809 RepID=A0ABX2INM9_9RHOB|nr:sulfite exporter TauE/SafE family protein [Sulfitobacter algicola]NSX54492.1 sulfite exporter TauE/SafE family protein [Sulfitobacter algicola]